MAEFKTQYSRGINQDISKENYPRESYFNLINGRFIDDESLSQGNISSFKGNTSIVATGITGTRTFPTKTNLTASPLNYISQELYDSYNEKYGNTTNLATDIVTRLNIGTTWAYNDIIGGCSILDDLILFTRCINSVSTLIDRYGVWRLRRNNFTKTFGTPSTTTIDGISYYVELIYISTEGSNWLSTDQIKIDCISYFESDNIQKVYWIDGKNSLRILNITEPLIFFKDDGLIDVLVNSRIDPFEFNSINSNGNLPCGNIQYSYRYFIPNGQVGRFSLPSPLIHLVESSETAPDANRMYKGNPTIDLSGTNKTITEATSLANSGKAITIKLEDKFVDRRHTNIEIVSIYYWNINANPIISTVYLGPIPETGDYYFTDYGTNVLHSYSLAEYRLNTVDYIPQTLAVKDNILFLGNLQEKFYSSENWENFDCRAFRYDSSGNCRLYDTIEEINSKNNDIQYRISGTNYATTGKYINNLISGSTFDISDYQELNAVNRFNNIDLTPNQVFDPYTVNTPAYQYCFQANGTTLGGQGPNVKFKFKTKGLRLLDKNYPTSAVNSGGDTLNQAEDSYVITSKANKDDTTKYSDNYGSPYNDAYYKQYKRNEIYRYFLVVYNKKGQTSVPKWICDIRTPAWGNNTTGVGTGNLFEIVQYEMNGTTAECTANALGIDFSIDLPTDLKAEIQGYSIVRCLRDENRTNLAQGLLSNLRCFSTAGDNGSDEGGNCSTVDGVDANINHLWWVPGVFAGTNTMFDMGYSEMTHYELISPEYTFNTNGEYFNSSYIQPVGSLQSVYYNNGAGTLGLLEFSNYKIYADNTPTYTIFGAGDSCRDYTTYTYSAGLGSWDLHRIDFINNQFFHAFSTLQNTNEEETTAPSSILNVTVNALRGKRFEASEAAVINSKVIGWNCKPVGGGIIGYNNNSMYLELDRIPIIDAPGTDSGLPIWTLVDYIRFAIPYGGVDNYSRGINTAVYSDNYIPLEDNAGNGYHVDNQYLSAYTLTRETNTSTNKVGHTLFGGDTYITYYQHVRTTIPEDNKSTSEHTGVLTFPCESTINCNLRYDDDIPTYSDNFNLNIYAESRTNVGGGSCMPDYLQLKDLNLYNAVYSKQNDSNSYVSVFNNSDLVNNLITRVIASKKKFIGEYIDSWSLFGVNEQIDLNVNLGPLSKLIAHKDQLYGFQYKGIARLGVNDKSTVQDNSGQSIVLGTGGILPYASYITNSSGSKHKWSVLSTPTMIHYYDAYRNKLCTMSDGDTGVSDVKGLMSYFKDNINPELLNSVDSVYYDKYREVHTTFDTTTSISNPICTTLVLSEKSQSFIEMFDSTLTTAAIYPVPFLYINFNNKILSNKRLTYVNGTDLLYLMDNGNENTLFGSYRPLKLILVINPFKDKVTYYDSLEFNSLVIDPSVSDAFNKVINDETITSIRIYNSYQDTGTIDLITPNARGKNWINRNSRKWRYNYIRDSRANNNIRQPNNTRLSDYYFIVELTFDSRLHTGSGTPRYFEIGNIISYFRGFTMTELG